MVIDTIFGVEVSLDGVTVNSRLAEFDTHATLHGLRQRDRQYVIGSKGARAI